jgi:predicted site-specific integrase-resolvase
MTSAKEDEGEGDGAGDVLVGGDAIAKELGVDRHTVYYWFKHGIGNLPIGRVGRRLVASRAKLRQAIKQMT